MDDFLNKYAPPAPLMPQPGGSGLTAMVKGFDESGQAVDVPVVVEKPMTIFLNRQEIVTSMTLGDWPEALAVGFLRNQNMLVDDDVITAVDVDDDLGVIVVRTERETNYEAKLEKKIRTSGCAQGTVFGDMMDQFDNIKQSTPPPAFISAQGQYMDVSWLEAKPLWSIWKMWGGIMRWIKSLAGCFCAKKRARIRSFTPQVA